MAVQLAIQQVQTSNVYWPIDGSIDPSWTMVGLLTLFTIALTSILFVYNFFYSVQSTEGCVPSESKYCYPFDVFPSAVPGSCISWPKQASDCTCFVQKGRDCRIMAPEPSDRPSSNWPASKCSAPIDRKGEFIVHHSQHPDDRGSSQSVLRSYTILPFLRHGNGLSAPHKPRSILIWCHDIHSHFAHSCHLAQHLALSGHGMMGIDYPGFGESREPLIKQSNGKSTRLAEIDHWQMLVESVEQFIQDVVKRFPSTPIMLGGEGIGGAIALHVAIRHSNAARHAANGNVEPMHIIGMVLVSPALHVHLNWKQRLWISIMSRVSPSTLVPALWPIDQISRNTAVSQHFINDPLCSTGPITARTANQLLSMIDALQWPSKNTNKEVASLASLSIPFNVQHGVKDLACSISGTRMLVEATSKLLDSQKRFLAHKNAWHGLLHEAEWERTCECVLEYIDDRLQHMSQSSMLD